MSCSFFKSSSKPAHLAAFLSFVLIWGCQDQTNQHNDVNGSKPNVIYILADDMGLGDIGAYGQERIKTPNLDQMAEEGMRFTRHYSGSTVCAPSRAVLMTGLHTGHSPIRGNEEIMPIGQGPIPTSTKTIAEVLKKADYTNAAFGKWGLGAPDSEGAPTKQGFDYFYGYNDQRRSHFYYPEFLFRAETGEPADRVTLEGNKVKDTSTPDFQHPGSGPPIKKSVYSQDAIMEEALTFIDEQANEEQPFFAYLPLNLPHASLAVPERALKPYIDEEGNSIFEEKPFPGGGYTEQPMPRATYAAMVTLFDTYVGKIFRKLKEKGIEQNTLVIFSSDNGPHEEGGNDPSVFNSSKKLRGIKRDLYEGGIRAPMIAWWPGKVQAGSKSDLISSFQDIMPTLAELAGVEVPENDGISLVAELIDKGEQPKHDFLYWEFPAAGGKQALRKGKWKAVRLNVKEDSDAPIELYDLDKDPSEQHNIASKHPDKVKELAELMEQAHKPSSRFPLFPSEKNGDNI